MSARIEVVERVLCAWCRCIMIEGTPGAPESHGICEECQKTHFADSVAQVFPRPLGAVPQTQSAPKIVRAETRKRCPHCKSIIFPGDDAVWVKSDVTHGVMQGLFHLHHPRCASEIAAASQLEETAK